MSGEAMAKWLKPAILLIFIGGLAAYFAVGGTRWLSLAALDQHRDALLDYTAHHTLVMVLVTVAVYVTATALSIPGAVILSLATGFLFGRWIGTVIIVCSATAGATLVFLAARYLFADALQRRLGETARRLIRGFHADAFHYLLFLRLVPVFPFWLVNLAPAMTNVPLRTYVFATAIGVVPGSFVFAHLGQSLGRIHSAHELISAKVLSAFVLLGVFALTPVVVKRVKERKTAHPYSDDP
jgi:uncharacterized membrane protein YdjX (TVP38/TMEM64 family)